MSRLLAAALVLAALSSPVLAVDAGSTSVTCSAAVTTSLGAADQKLRDLDSSDLPVLAYSAVPGDRQFKQLAKIDDVPIRLYVYRVNDKLLHMQIFEMGASGKGILADTPLSGDVAELTWRQLGGSEMVTAFCY